MMNRNEFSAQLFPACQTCDSVRPVSLTCILPRQYCHHTTTALIFPFPLPTQNSFTVSYTRCSSRTHYHVLHFTANLLYSIPV